MKCLSKFFLAVLLLTVASVSWAAQTIDQWGKSHYDAYGKAEGRTLTASGSYGDYVRKYPDLLAVYNATAGESGSTSSGGGCYGDYVRTHGDLLAAYNRTGGSQKIEDWGKSHYDTSGRAESRTLPTSCGGASSGGGSSGGGSSGGGCYGDYVRTHGDLLAAYNRTGGSQKIEDWGKSHYDTSGRAESRTLPTSCGGASSGGGSSGGATVTGSTSRINGEFSGWDGESIYGLINGQYWIQASYYYCYSYSYLPEVLIYYDWGWKMKVIGSYCDPVSVTQLTRVISSNINGEFNGWDGDSIYALTNGQIWKQAQWVWEWKWKFRPKVLVYYHYGWKMKVDGSSKTVRVTRLN